jgi:hypothetical protein
MPTTITPFGELMAYAVTGVLDKKCGAPVLYSAAQRFSEVHVTTGGGTVFGITTGGRFVTMATGGFVPGTGGNGLLVSMATVFVTAYVSDQFGGSGSPGGRSGGIVEQPARKTSAPEKMIPAVLNTRLLCGTGKRTQAVSIIYDSRFLIDAPFAVRP